MAKLYDMLPEAAGTTSQGRTAADNATVRSVFVIGPDKKIKAMLTYPMSSGRNFDEVLRLLDSCQLTAKHKVATPVNWKQGEDVIIVPAVSDAEAKEKFPGRLEGAQAVPARGAAAQVTSGAGHGADVSTIAPGRCGSGLGALMAGSLGGCAVAAKGDLAPRSGRRVVVVGGGWGGATAAKLR